MNGGESRARDTARKSVRGVMTVWEAIESKIRVRYTQRTHRIDYSNPNHLTSGTRTHLSIFKHILHLRQCNVLSSAARQNADFEFLHTAQPHSILVLYAFARRILYNLYKNKQH